MTWCDSYFRNRLKEKKKQQEQKLTATFVTDGAVGDGAALGDGHGHGGLDAGAPRGVRQHDGAQALGVPPDAAHLRAAVGRHRGARVLRGRRARRQLKRTRPHSPAPRTVSTPAATTTATTRRNHTHLTLLSIPCPPLSFSSSSSRRRLQLWAVLRSMILQASHGASIYAARRSTERGSKPSLGGRLRIPAGRTVWKPRKWRSHWRALSVARTELCSVQFGSVTYCTPLCWGACLASIKFSPKSLKICHVNGPWRKDFARRSVHNHHRCVGGLLLDQWHGRSSWKREKESTLPFPDRHRPLQYKAAVRTCSRKICWCQSARGKNRSELSSSEFIGLIPLMHYTDSGTLINRVIMILYTCYTWSRANRSTHHTA